MGKSAAKAGSARSPRPAPLPGAGGQRELNVPRPGKRKYGRLLAEATLEIESPMVPPLVQGMSSEPGPGSMS